MWRYHRGQQFFFVNGRWVKNSELAKAVTKGYANILPEGRFPAVFIFITLDSKFVDVNVHPRKEEVKFAKPLVVASLLQAAIKKALEQQVVQQRHVQQYEEAVFAPGLITTPQAVFESFDMSFSEEESIVAEKKSFELNIPLPQAQVFPSLPELLAQELGFTQELSSPLMSSSVSFSRTQESMVNNYQKPVQEVTQQQKTFIQEQTNYKIIGQLLNCYILVQTDDGMTMVDQHAMHERILYHKFLNNFDRKEGTRLMFPLMLNFKEFEIKILMTQADFFATHGIEFELFGAQSVRVTALPPAISHCNIQELFEEVIQFIADSELEMLDANITE